MDKLNLILLSMLTLFLSGCSGSVLLIEGAAEGGGNLTVAFADNTSISYLGGNIDEISDEYGNNLTSVTKVFYTGSKITSTFTNSTFNGNSTISTINITYVGDDITFVEYN